MKTNSTQQNIPIAGIKDGIVILKNGQYRLILSVGAINFDLKSEQEQNSLVFQYQSFLNSLHFPIQIVIQSKKLDLTPYINTISGLAEKQTNELLKMQTEDYADFVKQLIGVANIMKKTFYVVIGYQPLVKSQGGILGKIFPKKGNVAKVKITDTEFEHHSKELTQRAQTVASSLASMGLHAKQVSTQESIELFYKIFNPDISGKERMTEETNTSSSFVASETERPQEKAKNEDKLVQSIDGEGSTIDNTAQVQETQKQQASAEKQEKLAEAEKKPAQTDEKAPTTAPSDPSPDTKVSPVEPLPKIEKPNPAPEPDAAKTPVKDPNLNKNFGE